jgi:pentatricopeptide repeat domain-containing protein 1/leucine-rich PPR motif-containing protein
MAYKFGKLDRVHGKLALKILGSIVQQSGLERITHIYCMTAHILIQAQMHPQAISVLKHLAVGGFSCSAILSALLRTISRCDSSPMAVDLLINAYLKEKKVVDASKVILLMDACGFKASARSCNAILNALVEVGESKHVWLFLKESLARKFPLDVITCNIVLNSLCLEGNLKSANLMLQNIKSCSLANVVTYNTILYWYVKKGRFKAAMCVFEDMEKNCVEPDVYTYNIMIDKLCRMKRSARAYLLLKRMREDNLSPDECTYNTLIKGFLDEGKMKLAIYIGIGICC